MASAKIVLGISVCQSVLGGEIVRGHIATNVCVCDVAGIGGLNNGAKRNVKPDQLRPVPRDKCNY